MEKTPKKWQKVRIFDSYNDANELMAVAKLSRPLLKDFTKESLVRVKLDF